MFFILSATIGFVGCFAWISHKTGGRIRPAPAQLSTSFIESREHLVEKFTKEHPQFHAFISAGDTLVRIHGTAPGKIFESFEKELSALSANPLIPKTHETGTYSDGNSLFFYQWGAEN